MAEYVPVTLNQLPMADSMEPTDRLLFGRPSNGSDASVYTTMKVAYQQVSAQILKNMLDVAKNMLSCYFDREDIAPDRPVDPTYAVGAAVVQAMNSDILALNDKAVTVDGSQTVTGEKVFQTAPKCMADASSPDQLANLRTVSSAVETAQLKWSGQFFIDNNISAAVLLNWDSPSDSKAKNKKPLPSSANPYKYTVQNDCYLYVQVVSKQNSDEGTLYLRVNNINLAAFTENDHEMWWVHTVMIPMRAGTIVSFMTSVANRWYLRQIKELIPGRAE